MATSLPQFPAFGVHESGNTGLKWAKWVLKFENLMVALDIESAKRKRALLLYYAGDEVYEVFATLPETGGEKDYDVARDKLTQYFDPKKNIEYEVYIFRREKQNAGESLDTFHTRLRQLAMTCAFENTDREIKTQIVQSCLSSRLRRRALREDLTLPKLLEYGRALEVSETQASGIEESQRNHVSVNAVKSHQKKNPWKPNAQKSKHESKHKSNKKSATCYNCGGSFPHRDKPCPAKGTTCAGCGKKNHFVTVCRSTKQSANFVTGENTDTRRSCADIHRQSDSSDDEYSFSAKQPGDKLPTCNVTVEGKIVNMTVDSGASVNIMDSETFQKLKRPSTILFKQSTKIYPYGSTKPLPTIGVLPVKMQFHNKIIETSTHIVEGTSGNLLGYKTALDLGIIHIAQSVTNSVAADTHPIVSKFPDIFEGMGKAKDVQVKLHIDESIVPKQQQHRRIPFHIRKDVERELEKLEKSDIIEKVVGPTPWISPIVVVPKKNDEVRICVDMREANKAVKRVKHVMPTIDELITDLNGATMFSKLDLSQAYHQLELEHESRFITAFSTHVGLFQYKRLMFGINAASELFQNKLSQILSGLKGCKNMSDDIIVHGSSEKQHDKNIHAVLQRLQENNLKLNKEKCEFSQKSVVFYGHIFSGDGIRPDPKKISGIVNASAPQNASEVRSLLGMAQYVSRFIPNYSDVTSALRELTHKDAPWVWTDTHQHALDELKHKLSSACTVEYFDPAKRSDVIVDASPVGVAAMLCQDGKVVTYASRALSGVEQRYSQTEREMLAVVWSAEHFHLYLYGAEFDILTDHKPLIGIFSSQKQASARIARWRLRLLPYKYTLKYRPGKYDENPADYMSRHPDQSAETDSAEDYVNYVCTNSVPKALTLRDVEEHTSRDPVLQKLTRAIELKKWTDEELCPFLSVKDELAVFNGLVLRNTRIVLPFSLRQHAIELAHIGHQGIVKTKGLLREKVWFPGIDRMVEDRVKQCLPCQATTASNAEGPEPLKMTSLPSGPWKEVAVDFAGPFPTGEYLLVVVDEYSRFPEVEVITSTSAKATIPKLDAMFARQGIPDIVKSDNGPPFNGQEFSTFAKELGFQHRRITPVWSQANGEAERFMRTLNKNIRASNIEGRNWKREVVRFLRQYRATPHASTGIAPAEALNGRKMKVLLPETHLPVDRKSDIRETDLRKKMKMKSYADEKRHARESDTKIGDTVIVKQTKHNKLSTPYDPRPYTVQDRKGSMVTARRGEQTITRNLSKFKRVHPSAVEEEITFDGLHDASGDKPHGDPLDEPPSAPHDVPPAEPPQSRDRVVSSDSARRSKRDPKPPSRFRDFVMQT
jgi:transposase InsO family protein